MSCSGIIDRSERNTLCFMLIELGFAKSDVRRAFSVMDARK